MISIAAILSKSRRLSASSTYSTSLVAGVLRFSRSSYQTKPSYGHGGSQRKDRGREEVDGFNGDNKRQLRPQTVDPEKRRGHHSVNKAIICGKVGEAPVQMMLRGGRTVTVFTVRTGGFFDQTITEKSHARGPAQWHRIVVHNEEMGAYSVHNVVKNSSVYIEGSIETRIFHDTSNDQVIKIPEISVRADGKICLMNSGEKLSNGSSGDLLRTDNERLRRLQEEEEARIRAEYSPKFQRYEAAPPTPDPYYVHQRVKNSSVYGVGAFETRDYNDSFGGQVRNIREMWVPADEAERRRKEEAERMARFDEIAKKQQRRDWELDENFRMRREDSLCRSSDGLSRPSVASFRPRPKPDAPEEYAPRFQRYEGTRQVPLRPERYYDHPRVNSSVYDEDAVETRGYYDSFDGQVQNIQQIWVPADEAERLRKEEAKRMARFDEIAEKQRRRDWELEEKEMLRREDYLWRSSDGLSRPSEAPFRPRPIPDAPVEYAFRFQRYEGARQAGSHPERHYDHQLVKSSSVYDENAIETRGYSDSFDGQVQNIQQMRIPVDEAERRRKVDAERMARIEKQRQRDWELKEKERLGREYPLGRSRDGLSRPSGAPFRPHPKPDAPIEYAPRYQRSEGVRQAPPRPESDYNQRVKSSSVSDEDAIETRGGYNDRFDRQVRNSWEMRGPADEAERPKKKDTERNGRLDKIAEKYRQRGMKLGERERQDRETSSHSHSKSGALVEYEPRNRRREGASQPPPRPEPCFDQERANNSSVDVNDRFDSQVKNVQEVSVTADEAGEIDEDAFQEWQRKRLLEEEKQRREALAGESGNGNENPDSKSQDTGNRVMGKNEAELTEQGRKVVQELLESGLRTQYLLEKTGEREKCELEADASASGDSLSTTNRNDD